MWKSTISYLIIGAGLSLSGPAMAGSDVGASQSDYTSTEIVEFFIKSAKLGAARGICIGTTDECASKPAKSKGFDMLVSFEHNSSDLTAAARSNLDQIAAALLDRRLSAANFTVEGHTDASGSESYNLSLSERRAQTVTSFLLEKGVAEGKVSALGMGESAPRVEDAFDPSNRRVEIRINLQ